VVKKQEVEVPHQEKEEVMNAIVRSEIWDVVRRLDELGLKAGPIQDAVRRGHLATDSCTPNHPPLMRGILGWGETVCALREHLAPIGWEASDDNNFAIVVSPNGQIAIVVATGDEGTGITEANPSTRSIKGPHTEAAVVVNQLQLNLELFPPVAVQKKIDEQRATYVLLVHRAPNEVRCELSLPREIVDGRISAWTERIILNSIPLDGEPVEISSPDQPDLDIQVRRRSA